MVCGGIGGQRIKFETNVDSFGPRNLDSQFRLSEGETLLKALQDRVKSIQKPDTGIKLIVDNQDDLTTELDQPTEF